MEPPPRRRFLDGVKERRERHRERSRVVRAAVVLAGFVVVLVGLAMIPLPGPGLLVIAAGLAVLALEFVWAERLLERSLEQAQIAQEKAAQTTRGQRILGAIAALLAVAACVLAVLWWDIPLLPDG